MTGPEALAAYRKADALVKAGRYEEALQVPMKSSDRKVIEAAIALGRGANTANLKQDDPCPDCRTGFMEIHRHRFGDGVTNLPDCDWLECCECGFKTDPE